MKNGYQFYIVYLVISLFLFNGLSLAQWIQTNGPFGGSVSCVVFKDANIFAGTAGGGVYRSINNGTSWEAVNNGLPNGCDIKSLLVSGTNIFAALWAKGVYRSTDNGLNWVMVNNGLTNFTVYCLSVFNDTNIFAGTQAGVFRSTNSGENWTLVLPNNDIRAIVASETTIFVAVWGINRMFRSTNNGDSWTNLINGLTTGELTSLAISGSKIFVGGYSQGTFLSTNNGDSWVRTTTTYYWAGGLRTLAIIGTNLYAGTGSGVIYRSSDDGSTWAAIYSSMETSAVFTLAVDGTGLYAGTRGTHCVYFSGNLGTNWTDIDSGIISTGVGSLVVKDSYLFAGAGFCGVYRSSDNGENWTAVNNGLTDYRISDLIVKDTLIFAGTWGGGVFRSSNDGENWSLVNQGLYNQVLSLEIKDDNIYAGTYGGGVFRSTDNGASWAAINNGFDPNGIVFDFAVSGEFIFAGDFGSPPWAGVYRSSDNGNSWTFVSNGLTDTRISVLEFTGVNLFAGTKSAFSYGGTGVYRTMDNGANWTQVNNGLTNFTINSFYPVNEINLFAGTGEVGIGGVGNNAGVALTTNYGDNWTQINTGLWNTVVSAFVVNGDNLFIGAEGGGVWRRPLSEIIPTTTFQLSVSVANGWNMVSIPGLNTPDQNVNTWWAFRDPGASVFKYAGGYQSVTDATPGLGYWMKHTGALTYNTGEEWPAGGIQIVAHDPIAAESGWNLLGGYELSVTAANVLTNPPGLQSGPIYRYSGGYAVATTLDPGYGYWIKLTGAGQIIIPETMAKGEMIEYFPENWGRIIITDNAGHSYKLYAVSDVSKINMAAYDLPPIPPAGMFDIRFSSGRIAEDLNSAIKTIEMNGVTYPLTVRVEEMDMRLMDETGKNVNVNLKSGEDVEISDATIQKLMVSGELVPAEYALEQNYPNPFNPSTTIEFSLALDSKVTMKIFDTLGQEIAELINDKMSKGIQKIRFDASKLSSGMYLYKIVANGIDGTNFTSVKKMILIK